MSSLSSSSDLVGVIPKMGPTPTILSRKEIDALYETFLVVITALNQLKNVDYIVTGGSLLGAIRQHSILFCDDDIDIAIIEKSHHDEEEEEDDDNDNDKTNNPSKKCTTTTTTYEYVKKHLQQLIGTEYIYQIKPWEGGDRIRPKHINSIFIDLFVICKYTTQNDFLSIIGTKTNGQLQSQQYIQTILNTITKCSSSYSQNNETTSTSTSIYPFYHFTTRKAIEMWTKEVYFENELFPLVTNLKFGPYTNIKGPRVPIRLLKRAFGDDCFHVYYQSISHHNNQNNNNKKKKKKKKNQQQQSSQQQQQQQQLQGGGGGGGDNLVVIENNNHTTTSSNNNNNHKEQQQQQLLQYDLPPLVAAGGTWEGGTKMPLEDEHYIPIQPTSRAKRRFTLHNREQLFNYLKEQAKQEDMWLNHHEKDEDNDVAKIQQQQQLKRKNDDDVAINQQQEQQQEQGQQPHQQQEQEQQSHQEQQQQQQQRPQRTIYMDGVFDLFHIGHLEAIRQCTKLGNRVIIGVTGDIDASSYKRPPIVPEFERRTIVSAIKDVDNVICPCPLIVTKEFMDHYEIDLVVHGFASIEDEQRQEEFFKIPIQLGKFQTISYYHNLSTTHRIETICNNNNMMIMGRTDTDDGNDGNVNNHQKKDNTESSSSCPNWDKNEEEETDDDKEEKKDSPNQNHHKKWFGSTVAFATQNSSIIPTDPFPLTLRQTIEEHIRKATNRRQEALTAIRQVTGPVTYDQVMAEFHKSGLAEENDFHFDSTKYPLVQTFLQTAVGRCCCPTSYDLSRLHEDPHAKDLLLFQFTQQPLQFQQVFDTFVRNVCVPYMTTIYDCEEVYYQCFPCLRIVQPNEFSIGPHADVAYGHHPCSINFYIPLTPIGGTSALFLESRLGSEDWHPIEGDIGLIKHFAGAICTHWTTENKTDSTRVSIDFRLIPGPFFHALADGGSVDGGQLDVYRQKEGYYSCCRKIPPSKEEDGTTTISWERVGPLLPPDPRVGFPWTVKNWDTFWQKKKNKKTNNKAVIP